MADDASRGLMPARLAGPHGVLGLAIAVATLIVDQVAKAWLLQGLGLGARGVVHVAPMVDLVLVWNKGISYGLFSDGPATGRLLLIFVAVAAAVLLGAWLRRERSVLAAVGLGLIIGGALGNAIDRVVHGAVVDFLLLHWGDWNWYVFNIADAAIVVGVALLLYGAVIRGNNASADTDADSGT
jgi:signal peptidase II